MSTINRWILTLAPAVVYLLWTAVALADGALD